MNIVPKTVFSDADISITDRNSTIEIEFFAEGGDGRVCSSGRAIISRQVAYRLNFDLSKMLGMKPKVAVGPEAVVVEALRKAGQSLTRRTLLDRIEKKFNGRADADQAVQRLVADGLIVEHHRANTRGRSTRLFDLA